MKMNQHPNKSTPMVV